MKITDIKVLRSGLIVPTSPTDVETIRAELQADPPPGYVEYVTTLGEGVLASLIRVLPPKRVVQDSRDFRKRIKEYWFWTNTPHILTKARAMECIVIADTIDGDEVIYHPSNTRSLLFLPRGGEDAYPSGPTLFDALEWILTRRHRIRSRDFEPFHRPLYLANLSPSPTGIYSSLESGNDRGHEYVSGLEVFVVGSTDGFYAIIQQHADKPTVTRIHFDFEESGDLKNRTRVATHFSTAKSSALGQAEFRGVLTVSGLEGTITFANVVSKYGRSSRQAWTVSLPRKDSFWER